MRQDVELSSSGGLGVGENAGNLAIDYQIDLAGGRVELTVLDFFGGQPKTLQVGWLTDCSVAVADLVRDYEVVKLQMWLVSAYACKELSCI